MLAGQSTAIPKTADGAVEMMRQLKITRDTAVKARTMAMNTLKQIIVHAPPVLREALHDLTNHGLLTRCAGLRPGPIDTPTAPAKHTLRALARRWMALTDEIAIHDQHLARLTTETSPTLREGFGVGAHTAAELLIIFGDNPYSAWALDRHNGNRGLHLMTSLDWLISEAIQRLGPDADPGSVTEDVRRLQVGLPAEDEFSVLLTWLGRCRLVHKLDQRQSPRSSRESWAVPDLVAVFDYHGHELPVLIEVKTTRFNINRLSWRRAYRDALVRYADMLNLPLLVAWRFGNIWTLAARAESPAAFDRRCIPAAYVAPRSHTDGIFPRRALPDGRITGLGATRDFHHGLLVDVRLFEPSPIRYRIDFGKAFTHTLMTELAGDFAFSLRPGCGMHFKIRKLEETETGFHGRIEEAYWMNAAEERFTIAPGVFPLFLCLEQESIVTEQADYVTQSFVIPDKFPIEFAHRALVTLLRFSTRRDDVHWRRTLEGRMSLPLAEAGLRQAADDALQAGFLQYGMDVKPEIVPDFLLPYRSTSTSQE